MRAGLPLLAMAVLADLLLGRVWSDSVDLAHHYALVLRLLEYGNAAFPFDPSLGEMNVYPRLSHQMAVLAAGVTGSPLLGMQLVAVLSLVIVWAGLLWLVASLPPRVANRAALVLAVVLVLNHLKLRLPLHGSELIGGFFYAQLVGQAAFVAVLLASMALERRAAPAWLRHALLVPAIYLLTGIHLLPALFLLVALGWLVVADAAVQWRLRQPGLAVRGAVGAGLLLCALGALASHPGFAIMRDISRNNGVITVRHLNSLAALVSVSVVVAAGSAGLLLFWLRRQHERAWLPLKYLGVFGLSVACLALVQALALKLGLASDYALRKYAYALATMTVILLALLPGLLKSRARPNLAETATVAPRSAAIWCVMPALLVVLASLSVAWQPARFQTSALVALERNVQALQQRMGPPLADKFDYLIGVTDMPGVIAYMVSIAELRSPRWENPNANSLLLEHAIADWTLVGRLITSANGAYDRYPDCRTGLAQGGLVVLDGACLRRHRH